MFSFSFNFFFYLSSWKRHNVTKKKSQIPFEIVAVKVFVRLQTLLFFLTSLKNIMLTLCCRSSLLIHLDDGFLIFLCHFSLRFYT
jgi:hypothetical protein